MLYLQYFKQNYKTFMNVWQAEKCAEAWAFATRKHKGQKYGGPNEGEYLPYLNHLGSVAMEVMRALLLTLQPLDAELAVGAAILHDVLEDTDATFEELCRSFGRPVAEGVAALTKDNTLPKPDQMADSLARIKRQPKEIWLVKMADRAVNLSPPPFYWDKEKIQSYLVEGEFIWKELQAANEAMSARLLERMQAYRKYL
jgi:(p)ppGpp synthase/HD superfamily hydrolase